MRCMSPKTHPKTEQGNRTHMSSGVQCRRTFTLPESSFRLAVTWKIRQTGLRDTFGDKLSKGKRNNNKKSFFYVEEMRSMPPYVSSMTNEFGLGANGRYLPIAMVEVHGGQQLNLVGDECTSSKTNSACSVPCPCSLMHFTPRECHIPVLPTEASSSHLHYTMATTAITHLPKEQTKHWQVIRGWRPYLKA